MFALLPLHEPAEAHDLHHSVNTGNYESFFNAWDTAMGTVIRAPAPRSAAADVPVLAAPQAAEPASPGRRTAAAVPRKRTAAAT